MNKIGIVGGGGFIGSALARHLSKWFVVKVLDKKADIQNLKENWSISSAIYKNTLE